MWYTNRFFIIVLSLLVVVLAVLLFIRTNTTSPQYTAVYLTTGDLYFGTLTYFPYFGLKNAYLLQVNRDAQTPLSIQKFSNVFWGPRGDIRLNRSQVIWTAPLQSTGQLAQILAKNPSLDASSPFMNNSGLQNPGFSPIASTTSPSR